MAEENNKQRPLRKLTVHNFSVIKHAELEFGKITVLIGPQASGKSLLCKLAYFFGREAIRTAIDLAVNRLPFSEFESVIQREFMRWFPRGGWGTENWSISFRSESYEVSVYVLQRTSEPAVVNVSFGQEFLRAYVQRLEETLEEQNRRGFLLAPALQSTAATRFMAVAGRGIWDASTYIPAQRSYFVDIKKGYRTLAAEADPISAHFADVFANALKPSSSGSRVQRHLGGDVINQQNDWMLSYRDGRLLPLSDISSGDKETLPLLTALDYYESQRKQSGHLPSAELYSQKLYEFDDFTIEEPELSLFPSTQYDIVREIAALSNEIDFVPRFTITTHSPYILSSFNNLIEAGQAARNNPTLRDEVAKIIPEQYWIKEGDFRAYAIEHGNLKSILNESGFIESNYLDQVSEVIGDEFDKLLRLEYEHTRAS